MGNSFMNKTSNSENLLHMLQKPAEIFAGIMPMDRRIYSSRLYMRRCGKKDSQTLHKLMTANRDYLEKWLQPQPKVISIDCVRDIIEEDKRFAKLGQRLDLAIFDSANDEMLGRIALHSVDFGIQRSAGVSYWITEKNAGNGYATEALATLISFAFEEVLLHRIWLKIIESNKASMAVAKKLGFVNEGVSRKSLFVDGKWNDSINYALLDNEYDELADKWIASGYLGM